MISAGTNYLMSLLLTWEESTRNQPRNTILLNMFFFCKDDVSRVSGIKGFNIQEILADGSNWSNGEMLG